jgi:hypothetical protein
LRRLLGDRYLLSFVSRGDNGSCGTPVTYRARVDGAHAALRLGAPLAAVTLRPSARSITLQAVNRSGVLGYPVPVAIPR